MTLLKQPSIGICLSFFFTLLGCSSTPQSPARLPASPGIRYSGRFDFTDAAGARFTWSGSTISAKFVGNSVSLNLKNTPASSEVTYFVTTLDGADMRRVQTQAGTKNYPLYSRLSSGEHTVSISRDTEGSAGVSQFLGFDFGTNGKLLPALDAKSLRIEIIGDSITCGYGLLGADRSCRATAENEHNYLSYGTVAARLLNADQTTLCYSGKGVYHNWGVSAEASKDDTMAHDYLYTLTPYASKGLRWDFSKDRPADAVVINLGTNDFAVITPSQEAFSHAYTDFVRSIRKNYPKAHIYCAVGSMLSGEPLESVRSALESVVSNFHNQGDTRIHYIEFATQDSSRAACESHPNASTHQAMAEQLAAAIRTDLGL